LYSGINVLPSSNVLPSTDDDVLREIRRTIPMILLTKVQGIHKRIVRFQKLTRNLFLTLHGHNVHRQQRQLSKFLMLTAGPVSKMASQQEKAFCVLCFEVSRSVITLQASPGAKGHHPRRPDPRYTPE
jgi:hypothetical protein